MNYFIILCVLVGESYGQSLDTVINKNGIEVDTNKTCPLDGTPCFIKCCGQEQVLYKNDETSYLCVNKTDGDVDLSSNKDQLEYYAVIMLKKVNEIFLYRKVRQFSVRDVLTISDEEVDENKNSIETDYGTITPPTYCFDMIVNSNTSYFAYLINFDDNTEEATKSLLTNYGCLLSAFFILVTLIVHYLVKKLRQNMYIYLLMYFMASLMSVYMIDFVITFNEHWLEGQGREEDKSELCIWLSPISYFFMLSTFFWMNAMCFEIWRNLSKMKTMTRHLSFRAKIGYGMYAVGCPALLVVVALTIEHSDVPDTVAKPDFEGCMRDTGDIYARMYKFLPMGVLVFANIVLYSHTIYKVWASNRLPQGLTTTQANRNRQQLRIYISLSVLMGTSWVLEFLLILDGIPNWLEYVIDAFNVFIGVIIFFTTVFKRSIFVELCKRFNIDHRWVRESPSHKEKSSKLGSKSKGSYARAKTTDDSMQFESINVSQDLDKPTPLNPHFVQTKM